MRHNKNRIHLCEHVLYLVESIGILVMTDDMRLHLPGIKNHESRVINIHTAWQSVSLLESELQGTWKNGVASQHVANGVKGARMIIWSVANL